MPHLEISIQPILPQTQSSYGTTVLYPSMDGLIDLGIHPVLVHSPIFGEGGERS